MRLSSLLFLAAVAAAGVASALAQPVEGAEQDVSGNDKFSTFVKPHFKIIIVITFFYFSSPQACAVHLSDSAAQVLRMGG